MAWILGLKENKKIIKKINKKINKKIIIKNIYRKFLSAGNYIRGTIPLKKIPQLKDKIVIIRYKCK